MNNLLDTIKSGNKSFSVTNKQHEEFQMIVDQIKNLEAEGEIRITHEHKESSTGNRYIDSIKVELIENQ